jgi:membrane protease YdiL (CAAX protease family)
MLMQSVRGRLEALPSLANDPLTLITFYGMPFVLIDSHGVLYSIGAVALMMLMFPVQAIEPKPVDRHLLERVLLWLMPISLLFYQWVIVPRKWHVLEIDRIFEYSIAGSIVTVFPGIVHLLTHYVFVVIVLMLLRLSCQTSYTKKRIWLFTGLIILPLAIRSVLTSLPIQGGGSPGLVFMIMGLSTFYIPGLGEELVYRGLIFRLMERRFSLKIAVLLSSLLFMVSHYNVISLYWLQPELRAHATFNLFAILLLGCAMALIYHRTRSLLTVALYHGAVNNSIGYLFYGLVLAVTGT